MLSEAWKQLRNATAPVSAGAFLLSLEWKDHTTARLAEIAAFMIVIWDIGSWLRSRLRRRSDGPTTEPS